MYRASQLAILLVAIGFLWLVSPAEHKRISSFDDLLNTGRREWCCNRAWFQATLCNLQLTCKWKNQLCDYAGCTPSPHIVLHVAMLSPSPGSSILHSRHPRTNHPTRQRPSNPSTQVRKIKPAAIPPGLCSTGPSQQAFLSKVVPSSMPLCRSATHSRGAANV